MNYVRRFVFVYYADLLNIKFQKLEKVTDKLFVFTPAETQNIPFSLVKQMQKMGQDLEWVDIGDVNRVIATQIMSFHLGSLHEKVDLGVEFAIFSDDRSFDGLIAHILDNGRKCVRVKQSSDDSSDQFAEELNNPKLVARVQAAAKRIASSTNGSDAVSDTDRRSESLIDEDFLEEEDLDLESGEAIVLESEVGERATDLKTYNSGTAPSTSRSSRRGSLMRKPLRATQGASPDAHTTLISNMADDLVRRLIRSGNRPRDLSMLRSYILMHSEESEVVNHIDEIIGHMEHKGEIKIEEELVHYTF